MSDVSPAAATAQAPALSAAAALTPAAPAHAASGLHRRSALRRLQWAAQLAWLVPLVAFAAVAGLLYRQAVADAEQVVAGASRVAQEHGLKLFETNAMLLQRMLDLLGDSSEAQVLANGAEVHARLKAIAQGLPQVAGLVYMGSDARVVVNSIAHPPARDIDYSDREYVRAHRLPGSGVFVTEQLISRITRAPFFDMSLRRTRADGSFAGNVSVSLDPGYLTGFYAELAKHEPGLRFTVFRADGRLIARWPEPVEPGARIDPESLAMREIAAGAHSGSQRGPSAGSGAARLLSYRQLAPYPVYVTAAIDLSAVRAGWLRTVGLLAVFAVPATLLLTWLTRLVLTRSRREFDAAERLDEETALRQRMELALLQSQKLEALGRLTGGVAHDFNNLLMVITSNLFVHRRKHPDAAESKQLAAIDRAVSGGTKLTRQLLSFTRRQALVFERIDLRQRLPALVDLLAPVLGKTVELRVHVDPDVAPIQCDPAELELALINLAVNAKDAMPSGGTLEITASAGPSGTVQIDVADTGSGIPADIAARVFEPFFTTKPIGQGTGLGLSQVQALCHACGGSARIDARAEGGTRVRLVFPALAADSKPDEPAVPAAAVSSGDLRCHLLLVEDNEAVATATREMLEALGCHVERVAGADAALARLAAPGPAFNLVLSDIEMPGSLDGIALAQRVTEQYPGLPVLLMTGYAERLQEAVRRRFEVLPKPVPSTVLADAIKQALR